MLQAITMFTLCEVQYVQLVNHRVTHHNSYAVLDIDCVYDDRKAKPGLRTGAVENLNQRVGKWKTRQKLGINALETEALSRVMKSSVPQILC